MTVATNDSKFACNKWIVSAAGLSDGATHTTIAAALSAAQNGDTIIVKPGSYTEDLTVTKSVLICAFGSTVIGSSPMATITGKITISTNSVSLRVFGLNLITNSDYVLSVTGTSVSVTCVNCYLGITNNDGISLAAASSTNIYLKNCSGASSNNFRYFVATGGLIWIFNSYFGASTTNPASTISADTVNIFNSQIFFPISTSSTGAFRAIHSLFGGFASGINQTMITTAGTGTNYMQKCVVNGYTSVAMSIGSGTNMFVYDCSFRSSNTNAIDGAGTLNYANLTMTGGVNAATIATTTQTEYYSHLAKFRATGQPAFLAFVLTTRTNVTGDGTAYTIGTGSQTSEVFDQDSNYAVTGTFTAPITGKYMLGFNLVLQDLVAGTNTVTIAIVTSNATYTMVNMGNCFTGNNSYTSSVLADMDASDTATFVVTASGGTAIVDILGAVRDSSIWGYLAC